MTSIQGSKPVGFEVWIKAKYKKHKANKLTEYWLNPTLTRNSLEVLNDIQEPTEKEVVLKSPPIFVHDVKDISIRSLSILLET